MNLRNIVRTVTLSLSLLAGTAYSQSYKKTDKGIKAEVCDIDIELQFYTPAIIRVIKTPNGVKPFDSSFSVIKTPEETKFVVGENNGQLQLESDSLKVSLDLHTGKISYSNIRGRELLTEKDYGIQFTPIEYENTPIYLVRQAFRLDKEEAIYGLGQHQKGKMNQRNQMVHLRQVNTDIAVPYIQSIKGYSLFWDNYSPTTFTDNPMEMAFDSQSGECADYYFMYGGTADNVMKCMRDLTGQVQMNALWTYGFWQSRERYQSQEELLDVVKKYRELQVPLDGIVQDWQYWGVDPATWNAVEFGNPLFSDPKKMIDEVHQLNAHIAISVWPSFGKKTNIHQELKEQGLLLDFKTYPEEAEVYDVFHPKAREIYWEYMNKNMFSIGMDGWWLDATEPEFSDKDNKLNQLTHAGQLRKVANAFPIVSVGGVYDHQRAVSSDKRVFILTRSAFAGQQRYGANSWSGDIQATWEVLRKQISAGLNFSVCGIPYWNTDIGGFITWNSYREGVKDPAYRELYVRWTQFGAFTPMMRSHGTNTPREIYQFGEKGSWEFNALEKYINLRYMMLPYLYSTAWSVSDNGDTFMRPLFMDFPQDVRVHDMDNQYMFGRSLLIVPVTEPMYVDKDKKINMNDIKTKQVYLPAGNDWFDFWTGEKWNGEQTISKETPVDIMPIYVKAGSIFPVGPKVQYATEKKWDKLEIRVYPGEDGTFVLYEDENDNYNYEKGMYSTITFKWDNKKRILSINDRVGKFSGMLKKRTFNIVLVEKGQGTGDRFTAKATKVVTYNGKSIRVKL